METLVKLQKVGNSLRATIPKEVANALSLGRGDELVIDLEDDTVVLRKKGKRKVAEFYGALNERTGEVRYPLVPQVFRIVEHVPGVRDQTDREHDKRSTKL